MIDRTYYLETARKHFGISYLKPYQELIITHILNQEKSRILGCLPTGSGKSICFMLPSILLPKHTIILYPLIALMNDQRNRFYKSGIKVSFLKGEMEKEDIKTNLKLFISGENKILITNVEMLLILIEKGLLYSLKGRLQSLIIDEAHTIVQWGESFRPSFLRLAEIIDYLQPSHLSAYTATMDENTKDKIIKLIFNGTIPYIVHSSSDRENIFYHSVRSFNKIEDIKKILKSPESRPAVIFSRSRIKTEQIAALLNKDFNIRHYHAGMDKEVKLDCEKWFYDSSDGVLSATIAYGLGLDKPNIRTVIHTYLPEDPLSFLQEAGRGGRDGVRTDSYVLYKANESSAIKEVFTGSNCIRTTLLKLMGEEVESQYCLACSKCVPDQYAPAGENEIMRFIKRHPFITKDSASSSLERKLSKKGIWNRKQIASAIDSLIVEMKIKTIWKWIYIGNKKIRAK